MRLGSVNPIRLMFGPIFQMEVRTAGRRRSTYVFRTGVGLLVLAFFALTLFSAWGDVSVEPSPFRRIQAGQNIAPMLVSFIIWTQYIALVLLAPLITGPALCDERRNRTMAALLTTPLTAWEIVLGKLTGRLSQALILALIAVPMVFAARMLGGVSVEGIVASVVLTIVSVFMASSLTLLLSAVSPRATTAAISAFVIFLCFNFGPLTLGAIYLFWIRPHFTGLPGIDPVWMFSTSLPIALGAVVYEHFIGDPMGMASMQMWGRAAIYGSVVTVGSVALAGVQLRRAMRDDPEALMDRPEPKKQRKRRRRGTPDPAEGAVDTPEGVRSVSRVVSDRPVLWRELNIGAFRKRRRLAEAVVVLVVIFGLMYINGGMQEQAAHGLIVIIGIALLMLQAIFGATGSIAHERQSRTLDVLLTTPLRPSAIILGKTAGVLRRMWFVPLAVGIHFLLAALAGVFHPFVLPLLALAVLPSAVMFVCTGVLLSVFFQKATSAAIANLFLALLLYLGLPVLLAMVQSMFSLWDDLLFDRTLTAAFSINPFVMGMIGTMGTSSIYAYSPGGEHPLAFEMPRDSMGVAAFFTLLGVAAAIELAVACGSLFLASRMLPERFGRSS